MIGFQRSLLQEIDDGNFLKTEDLVTRIMENRRVFIDRNRKKQRREGEERN
jgi:hypothetical protein